MLDPGEPPYGDPRGTRIVKQSLLQMRKNALRRKSNICQKRSKADALAEAGDGLTKFWKQNLFVSSKN